MYGSLIGNLVGVGYFLSFQLLGICLALYLFYKEKLCVTVLFGSVLGSFAFHWLPTLFAFIFNFTVTAHILAFTAFVAIVFAACVCTQKRTLLAGREININIKKLFKDDPILFLLLPLLAYVFIVLLRVTIPSIDGTMHSGQSTFGDMNMHLGFVSSIANQKVFPPEYSILPGTQLAYPFLSDSISSSVYIWGTSLRVAYLLPMFFALIQVFFGAYTLTKRIYQSYCTTYRGKSILAIALFLLNGGFGFVYFIDKGFFSENFTRIFTAFYETPTNYVEANIQWHNIICDMLIPQRATLFGWAMLFPILILLHQAMKEKDTKLFVIAGILSAGLPLIHTHSFLALGVLCAGFVTIHLVNDSSKRTITKRLPIWKRLLLVVVSLFLLTSLSSRQMSDTPMEANAILAIGIGIIVIFAVVFAYVLWRCFDKKIITQWGIYLGIVLLIALPILFTFTFKQASGENFVRGMFNWANSSPETMDNYLIFYIKNLGIVFIVTVLILIFGKRKHIQTILPATFLWLISEFILFQPNSYDNNKLMLVSYYFFCVATADFVWDTIPSALKKLLPICKERLSRGIIVGVVAFLGCFAAVLTMGREWVADYELYDKDYVKLCEWVEENTEPDEIFLTNNNHNNAIASLTGRNIVCGSSSFLFFHGLDYLKQEADVRTMYENPASREDLLDQYNVSYIVVGPYEFNNYSIPDLQQMAETYEVVYNSGNIVVFSIY